MAVTGNSNKEKLDHLSILQYMSQYNLDENFITVFAPFRILQMMLGSCRINVRDNFITGPTILQKIYSSVYITVTMFSSVSISQIYFADNSITDTTIKTLFLSGLVGTCLMNLLNVVHTRFLNNKENAKLLVQMQIIDRVMKINSFNIIYNSQYKVNLKATLILITGYISLCLITLGLTWDHLNIMHLFGPMSSALTFTIEAACCCSHVAFFTNRIRLINFVIMNHLQKKIRTLSFSIESNMIESLKKIANEWQDFEASDMDDYIEHIFSGFSYFQELYKFQV